MSSNKVRRWVAVIIVAGLVATALTASERAPLPELVLDIGDANALPGDTVKIPVYLSNYFDTIAGFNFWVQLDRPDIMEFSSFEAQIVDTTYWHCNQWIGPDCVDSVMVSPLDEWDWILIDTVDAVVGTLDTTGTMVSGWEYVDSRSLGGLGHDLNVVGIANMPPPPTTPGIPIQENGVLVKLVGLVYDIPDTMTERTVNIIVQAGGLDHLSFSDPQGNSIGVVCDSIPDTSFWRCLQWAGEVCLAWERVSGPPYDSMSIDGYSINCYLDTGAVHLYDGSVTVRSPLYGDADCSASVDISDLVYAVDFMFTGGPPIQCLGNVDCDDDGLFTITDLICLVDWMFPPVK